MFLLDTNVVSELRKSATAHRSVAEWADSVTLGQMYVSVITILEIERGVSQISRRDPQQGNALRAWLHKTVIPQFSDRILFVGLDVALSCAALHVPDPKPELDALIAATALVHDLTVVTRNTRDFEPMGVKLLNPWSPAEG